jgi:hypothetical protein
MIGLPSYFSASLCPFPHASSSSASTISISASSSDSIRLSRPLLAYALQREPAPFHHASSEDLLCQLLVSSLKSPENESLDSHSETKQKTEPQSDKKESDSLTAPSGPSAYFSDPLYALVRLPQLTPLFLVRLVKV